MMRSMMRSMIQVDRETSCCVQPRRLVVIAAGLLAACGGSVGAGSGPGMDAPAPDAPTLSAVAIVGYGGSRHVRMGAEARLLISGVNLAGGTVTVADLPAKVVDTSSDTMLVVDLVLPHGDVPGDRSLEVSTPRGKARMDGALHVTAITASPSGDDGTGRGTDDAPFRTATHAAAVSDYLDSIELRDGEYAAGETWPVQLKLGVQLAGASRSRTVLRVDGQFGVQTEGRISNLTILGRGPDTLACVTGRPWLTAVRIENCGDGINSHSALIQDVVFRNVQAAVVASLSDRDALAIDIADIELAPSLSAGGRGVIAAMQGFGISVLIDRTEINAPGRGSIWIAGTDLRGSGSFKMRRTHVRGRIGVSVDGQDWASLDLGTPTDRGQNTIDASEVGVLDERSPLAAPVGLIMTLSGTVLNGRTFDTGALVTGAVTSDPYYQILSQNNRISF